MISSVEHAGVLPIHQDTAAEVGGLQDGARIEPPLAPLLDKSLDNVGTADRGLPVFGPVEVLHLEGHFKALPSLAGDIDTWPG